MNENPAQPKNYQVTFRLEDGSCPPKVVRKGKITMKNVYTEFEALAKAEMFLLSDAGNKAMGALKMKCVNIEVETLLGFMPTGSLLSKSWWDG